MNRFKINVDRKIPETEYIQSKQNFKEVLNQVAATNTSIWQSTWFYGTVGLASLAVITTFAFLTPKESNAYDAKNTPATQITTTHKHEVLADASTASAFAHSHTEELQPVVPVGHSSTTKKTSSVKKYKVKPVVTETTEVAVEEELPIKPEVVEKIPTGVPDTEVVPRTNSGRPGIPNISGVYNGEIKMAELCDGKIEVSRELLISSFLIQYSSRLGDRSQQVKGNHITPEICEEIRALGVDQMIFVTNIIAEDLQGDKHMVIPMNFTVVME